MDDDHSLCRSHIDPSRRNHVVANDGSGESGVNDVNGDASREVVGSVVGDTGRCGESEIGCGSDEE